MQGIVLFKHLSNTQKALIYLRHIKHVIFDISREKILSLGDHGEGGFELEGLGLANAGLAGQEDCAVGDFVVLDHLEDHASGLVGDD